MGEKLTTASGGNFVSVGFGAPGDRASGSISAENGRQPRATNRNERAVRGTVAKIEVADGSVNKYGLFTIVSGGEPGKSPVYGAGRGGAAAGS